MAKKKSTSKKSTQTDSKVLKKKASSTTKTKGVKKSSQLKKTSSKKAATETVKTRKANTVNSSVTIKTSRKKVAEQESWSEGSIGSVLYSNDPHDSLSLLTPDWLKELRAAESADFERVHKERYEAEQVLRTTREELMSHPDVSGTHVGYRRRDGKIVYPLEVCIRIHVTSKYKNKRDGRIGTLFEKSIQSVPIDVLQRQYDSIALPMDSSVLDAEGVSGESVPPPTRVFDPLLGGAAIAKAVALENWGTLGVPVMRNGKTVLLTNAHVAGTGRTTYGEDNSSFVAYDIVHPPIEDGTVVGQLSSLDNMVRDKYMDAAVITLNDANAIPQIRGLPPNSALRLGDPIIRDEVFIIGAASGLAYGMGVIQTVNGSVDVKGFGSMYGQIIATPLTSLPLLRPGDSGSALLSLSKTNSRGYNVVGLVHAKGTDGSLVATPMFRIADRFGVTLF